MSAPFVRRSYEMWNFLNASRLKECFVYSSVADHLPNPWSFIVKSPHIVASFGILAYSFIVLIYWPFYGISFLITSGGSWLILFVSLYLIARLITRLIAFPGSAWFLKRSIEQTYAVNVRDRLIIFCENVLLLGQLARANDRIIRDWERITFLNAYMVVQDSLDPLGPFSTLMAALKDLAACRVQEGGKTRDHQINVTDEALSAALSIANAFDNVHTATYGCHNYLSAIYDAAAGLSSANFWEARASLEISKQHNDMLPELIASCLDLQAVVQSSFSSLSVPQPNMSERGEISYLQTQTESKSTLENFTLLFKALFKSCNMPAGLDLMRFETTRMCGGEQVWIPVEGAILDCCYVPSGSKDGRCCVFCGPNAGLWETHGLAMQFRIDWLAYYKSIGCSVMVLNYRGYGRSTGTPNPINLSRDVGQIMQWLKNEKGASRILIHGESIGGMVAAGAARRYCDVDTLVIDRSFGSLRAVAQRIVGSWAGPAVTMLAMGRTNTAEDYISAVSRTKIIANDPNDEMIANTASAQVAVALRVELGVNNYSPKYPPNIYAMSDYLRVPPPSMIDNTNGVGKRRTMEGRTYTAPWEDKLTESLILHWAFSLRYIAHSCSSNSQSRRAPFKRRENSYNGYPLHSLIQNDIEMVNRQNSCGPIGPIDDIAGEEDLSGDDDYMPDSYRIHKSHTSTINASPLDKELWKILLRIEGLNVCINLGLDAIRAWIVSAAVWGSRTTKLRASRERNNQSRRSAAEDNFLSIEEAVEMARHMRSYPCQSEGQEEDDCISACLDMLDYLAARSRIQTGLRTVEREGCEGGKGGIGMLLPLHCGHNSEYPPYERLKLTEVLSSVGWVDSTALEMYQNEYFNSIAE
eukprot:69872_1